MSCSCFFYCSGDHRDLHSFPTRRSSDLEVPLDVVAHVEALDREAMRQARGVRLDARAYLCLRGWLPAGVRVQLRSEEHTSELQSRRDLVCRLLLEKKKKGNEVRQACITA